jgi:hypothetical protein
MPPWLVYVFLVLHGGGDGGGIQAASDVLGSDGVAVAEDQDGNAIIELGANDTESLERATAALRDAYGDSLSDAYAVTGDGLVRA